MSTTTINAALTYLVAKSKTTWAGDSSMTVFDGPTAAGAQLASPNRIWIGADPTNEEAPGIDAVTGSTAAATLSQGRTLDEQYTITCAIESWNGGTDFSMVRAAAFGYMGTFQGFLRGTAAIGPGDTTMGGALGAAGWSQTSISSVHQYQLDDGCDVVIVFHVLCRARLTA